MEPCSVVFIDADFSACVVGACVVDVLVVGACVVGACVIGACVVGACVVGACVVGSRVTCEFDADGDVGRLLDGCSLTAFGDRKLGSLY